MTIDKIKVFCFSPTGTTKKNLLEIASGTGLDVETINLTFVEKNEKSYEVDENTLALVGIPVYAGRIPKVIEDTLKSISGKGYAVPVVVYGNRAYEDALVELEDILKEDGFKIVAGGAFIGEHSYTSRVATSRPDSKDLEIAKNFGEKIREKLEREDFSTPTFSGNRPYKERKARGSFAPNINNNCIYCRKCWKVCPVGAIDERKPDVVEVDKCILCYACIKVCTFGGREIFDNPLNPIIEMLETKFINRQEPEIFI